MNLFHQAVFLSVWMLFLLAISAFFSGSETALFSLAPDSVRRMSARAPTRDLMKTLRVDPSGLLTSILFGNLIVNILFFSTGAVFASRWGLMYGAWAEAVAGGLILFVIILFGELIPKAVGVTHTARVLHWTAPALRTWFLITKPVRLLVRTFLRQFELEEDRADGWDHLSPGEFKELLRAVKHEPGFGDHEKEILEDIVNLSVTRIREVMVPRVNVLRCALDTPSEDLLREATENQFSRILIFREKDEDLAGYVRVKDLFAVGAGKSTLESFLRPLVFVPETKRTDELLGMFTKSGLEMAAVVDEYGGLAGIVTVDDLLEEIVGEFSGQTESAIEQINETSFRLSGRVSIREWRDLFKGFLPDQEVGQMAFDTIGGLVISLLGRMPEVGDRVLIRNISLTVETIQSRHIEMVRVDLESLEDVA